jgi:cobalt-zinc-cadmium efflux system protein
MSHNHEHHEHHHHNHHAEISNDSRALKIAMACTASIFVAQVIGGYFSHSLALLSDAGHMLADVGALLIAFLALRFYSRSQSDSEKLRRYTFGFRRIEVLAALVNGVVLLGICGFLMYEAVERFFRPQEVLSGEMIFVATIGLIANGISALVLYKSHHISTRSAYLHVLTDLLSSVAVIIGGVLIYYTHQSWIDSVLSFGISLFIIRSAFRLVKSSGIVLMDSAPAMVSKDIIERELLGIEDVVSVHDVHVWQISQGENTVSAHIVVLSDSHHDVILHNLRTMLQEKFSLVHSTIQIESKNYSEQQHCDSCQLQDVKHSHNHLENK